MSTQATATASRTAQPPATGGPVPAIRPDAGQVQSPPAVKRTVATPRALRWWTFGTALACAIFALATLATMFTSVTSADDAAADTDQLIRVQSIRANLLRADALATNAFLVGGLEPAAQRADYDRALQDTTVLITHAASAQPADRDALAELNKAVTQYAADMEQARANNRQGYPVGAAYLGEASTELRSTALPILDILASTNTLRAQDQLSAQDHGWFEVIGVACLVVLIAAMVWSARRFHRVVNPGLVLATALVLAVWLAGTVMLSSWRTTAADVRSDQLATISAVGEVRASANEAKVQESLRLIAHGSGGEAEKAWKQASEDVTRSLAPLGREAGELQNLWASYVKAHNAVVALDAKGEWQKAVDLATGTAKGSPNPAFDAFDERAADLLTSTGGEVRDRTAAQSWVPLVLMLVSVPALVVAGISAGMGLRARLREYL